MGSLGRGRVKFATLGRFVPGVAQGLAVEFQAVRVVHEAVEDRVGDGRVDDQVVPVSDRDLVGQNRRAAAVAVVDDLKEITAC